MGKSKFDDINRNIYDIKMKITMILKLKRV